MAHLEGTCPRCKVQAAFPLEQTHLMQRNPAMPGDAHPNGADAFLYLSGLSMTRCPGCAGELAIVFRLEVDTYLGLVAEGFPEAYEAGEKVPDDTLFAQLDADLAQYAAPGSLELNVWPPGFP